MSREGAARAASQRRVQRYADASQEALKLVDLDPEVLVDALLVRWTTPENLERERARMDDLRRWLARFEVAFNRRIRG